jgi:hypothetical protein
MKWKPITNYEGIYEISENGDVKRIAKTNNQYGMGHILKHNIINGYAHVQLHKDSKVKIMRVHRLVSMAFIPNEQNKPHVNHIDGNKLNNHISNLEWCTRSENVSHALKTGLSNISITQKESIANTMRKRIGDKNPNSKKVIDLSTGIIYGSVVDAAKIFNIKAPTLTSRLNGANSNKTTLCYYNPLDQIK